jgi:hypothetical protein
VKSLFRAQGALKFFLPMCLNEVYNAAIHLQAQILTVCSFPFLSTFVMNELEIHNISVMKLLYDLFSVSLVFV